MSERTAHPHAHDAGAYALGALRDEERTEFERHLAACDACQAAVAEVAVLPALLAGVPAEVAAELTEDTPTSPAGRAHPPPPPSLLAGLLDRVRAEERRLRRRRLAGGALALAAVVALGVAVVLVPGLPWNAGSAGDEPTTRSVTLVPTGQDVGVTAVVELTPVPWGTRLEVTCRYTEPGGGAPDDGGGGYGEGYGDGYGDGGADGGGKPAGTGYALVLVRADGTTERVATWQALPGRDVVVPAGTGIAADDIVRIDLRSADGAPLLSAAT